MKIRYGDISDGVFCAGMACALHLPPVEVSKLVIARSVADISTPPQGRRPESADIAVLSFPQEWPTRHLGFRAPPGGEPAVATSAQTTVVMCGQSAAVYFGREIAYAMVKINPAFVVDLQLHNMASVEDSRRYVEAAPVHQLHAV